MIVHLARRPVPIDAGFLLVDLLRVGSAILRLRGEFQIASFQVDECTNHQPRANVAKPIVQVPRRHQWLDSDTLGQGNRTGIEAFVHLHDHHAGLRVPCHDSTLDRRSPAPARQQRRMAVEGTEARSF